MLNKLLISFSGGRTSGYMTKKILEDLPANVDSRIVFANTGQEDERTLEFVNNCEKVFGWDIYWVEAVTHHGERKAPTHKIVDFESASRKGEPFEESIKKYGIPNPNSPHCTRSLKLNPIKSLVRSWGWKKGTYETAIGIRIDEIDRMSSYADKEKIIYPLVKWKVDKEEVLSWWKMQNFDLNIPEHRGNCVTCWKKSFRKLVQIYREDPHSFEFFDWMEKSYGDRGSFASKTRENQKFFRGQKSVDDIKELANSNHKGFVDPNYDYFDEECAESCEVFSDFSLSQYYKGKEEGRE